FRSASLLANSFSAWPVLPSMSRHTRIRGAADLGNLVGRPGLGGLVLTHGLDVVAFTDVGFAPFPRSIDWSRPHRPARDLIRFIHPCSPVLTKAVTTGPDWLHEVKFDGYRVQVHKTGREVEIFSRNGHDFTARYLPIALMLAELPARSAVMDGELVATDAAGIPNFVAPPPPGCGQRHDVLAAGARWWHLRDSH